MADAENKEIINDRSMKVKGYKKRETDKIVTEHTGRDERPRCRQIVI